MKGDERRLVGIKRGGLEDGGDDVGPLGRLGQAGYAAHSAAAAGSALVVRGRVVVASAFPESRLRRK